MIYVPCQDQGQDGIVIGKAVQSLLADAGPILVLEHPLAFLGGLFMLQQTTPAITHLNILLRASCGVMVCE